MVKRNCNRMVNVRGWGWGKGMAVMFLECTVPIFASNLGCKTSEY